jgi:8-oxo-dGTP pyrophosphatase MutT (NUDIX family)
MNSSVPLGRPTIDETHNPWSTLSSTVRYDNAWISVRHDEVIDPGGRNGIYGVVSPKNLALGVLPLFDDGTVMLVGQYRYVLSEYSWEMPEGGGAKDVDPLDSIRRELREETGHEATDWLPVCQLALSNSVTDERATCWLAWGLRPHAEGAEPESTEDLALWRLPFSELVDLVWSGVITDSMTVATVAKVEAMRLRRELPAGAAKILAS